MHGSSASLVSQAKICRKACAQEETVLCFSFDSYLIGKLWSKIMEVSLVLHNDMFGFHSV